MNGAGWVNPTSYEVMRMKAVNHKPMTRPGGNPRPSGRGGSQYPFKGTFNQIARQIGEAFPPLLAEKIGKRLKEYL
jgi:site-specific DNA-cytosine methylase